MARRKTGTPETGGTSSSRKHTVTVIRHPLHPSDEVGCMEVDDQSSPLADRYRNPTDN
ncbi:hypothetical protein SH528x_002502 [Novipirellula sp. SH528]|uniref:hypothetical protein n=1 Tax=Novipirellula sp. SH528 TaxID=3454466 RepID=UPI003F9EEDB1